MDTMQHYVAIRV